MEGWPAIQRGEHTLILSPTGSGKTLAAFLWGIDELYREVSRAGGDYEEGVRLLYVSPLKALNNDVERNLRAPLAGIRRVAKEQGAPLPRLDVLVRTGDTPQSDRRRMVKHPPHILITTPESLQLLLATKGYDKTFRSCYAIVVDEWHELLGSKRGVQMELALSRLKSVCPQLRIWGISATIGNLEQARQVLLGPGSKALENSVMIRAHVPKRIVVKSLLPERMDTFPWRGHLGLGRPSASARFGLCGGDQLVPALLHRLQPG